MLLPVIFKEMLETIAGIIDDVHGRQEYHTEVVGLGPIKAGTLHYKQLFLL